LHWAKLKIAIASCWQLSSAAQASVFIELAPTVNFLYAAASKLQSHIARVTVKKSILYVN